jgi:hypothetical protein
MLEQDTNLLELVRTPFLLNITAMSYELLSLAQWQQLSSRAQRVEYLLDIYVQQMLQREIPSRVYRKHNAPNAKQTKRWLVSMAQYLQQESRTEFLLGKMQMSWLLTDRQAWFYNLMHNSVVLIPLSLLIFVIIPWLILRTVGWLIFGLILGVIIIGSLIIRNNLFEINSVVLNIGLIALVFVLFFMKVFEFFSWVNEMLRSNSQHFAFRLILFQSGYTVRFLEYCTEHHFLQRVGRRYRFVHKLLEDYFATMSC